MDRKGKASTFLVVFLLVVFSFAALGAAAYYYLSFDKEKSARVQLAGQLQTLQKEKDKIQNLLEEANKEKIILEKKINEHTDAIAALNEQLAAEEQAKTALVSERDELAGKLTALTSENKALNVRLEEKVKEAEKLDGDLKALTAEHQKLLESAAQGPQEASSQGQASSQGENLDAIVVSPSDAPQELGAAAATPTEPQQEGLLSQQEVVQETSLGQFSANVLLVNREHSFVVVDAGKQKGLNIGDVLDVFHGGESIGNVKVQKAHDTLSAADFLENFKSDLVAEGDVVKRIH